jgi:hypothetical protein
MAIGSFKTPLLEGSPSSGFNYSVNIFTSSATWSKPSGFVMAYVLIIGGGAGGSGGARQPSGTLATCNISRSGAVTMLTIYDSDIGATASVLVGNGGSGGPSRNSNGVPLGGSAGGASGFNGILATGGAVANNSVVLTVTATSIATNLASTIERRKAYTIYSRSNVVIQDFVLNNSFDHNDNRYRGNLVENSTSSSGEGNIIPSSSLGGAITTANVLINGGPGPGVTNVLTGLVENEVTGATVGVSPSVRTNDFTIGDWLVHKGLAFLDPTDIPQKFAIPGAGGGPGDAAGTINGGNGANASGYGGSGGGGGASRTGANSGAGGNGTQGLVVVINILN